jgi:D-tyrosyl-tRNA(Tyr) deacylase
MIGLLQRVADARVVINGETVGKIGQGLLLLLCAEGDDTEAVASKMLDKILKLRIFADAEGRMNRSLQDVGGGLLIVSQFTLAADTRSGNRPGFSAAARPELGRALYDFFVERARALHPVVESGRFGADMKVHLVNDGPVTIPMRLSARADDPTAGRS